MPHSLRAKLSGLHYKGILKDKDYKRLCHALDLEKAEQEQKSGKWIDYSDEGYVECPFCGHATNCEDDIDELHYCFYCGAKMESEDKE